MGLSKSSPVTVGIVRADERPSTTKPQGADFFILGRKGWLEERSGMQGQGTKE